MTIDDIRVQLPEAVKTHKNFDETIEIGGLNINYYYRYVPDYEGRVISECFVYLKEIGEWKYKKVWKRHSLKPNGDIPQSQIKAMLEAVEKYLEKNNS